MRVGHQINYSKGTQNVVMWSKWILITVTNKYLINERKEGKRVRYNLGHACVPCRTCSHWMPTKHTLCTLLPSHILRLTVGGGRRGAYEIMNQINR